MQQGRLQSPREGRGLRRQAPDPSGNDNMKASARAASSPTATTIDHNSEDNIRGKTARRGHACRLEMKCQIPAGDRSLSTRPRTLLSRVCRLVVVLAAASACLLVVHRSSSTPSPLSYPRASCAICRVIPAPHLCPDKALHTLGAPRLLTVPPTSLSAAFRPPSVNPKGLSR